MTILDPPPGGPWRGPAPATPPPLSTSAGAPAPAPAPASSSPDALDRLFGKRPDGLPVWLRPEALEAPHFDPEEYMGDVKRLVSVEEERKREGSIGRRDSKTRALSAPSATASLSHSQVPLDTLASELHAYLATLRSRLTDVLNADYDDFIALSSGLADVEGAVAGGLRPRLAAVRAALAGAAGAVAARQAALRAALARRDDARASRAGLELVRDAAAAAARAEALLAEAQGGVDGASPPASDAPSLADRGRALERAAAAITRLGDLTVKGRGVPLVDVLAPRAAAARGALSAALRGALGSALAGGQQGGGGGGGGGEPSAAAAASEAALHVLQAWAALGEPREAEAAVAEVALAPLFARALEEEKRDGGGDDDAGAAAAVPAALEAALATLVASPAGALLRAVADPAAGLGGLRLLPAAVAAAGDALAAAAPAAFSPGVPATFAASYAAAEAFIAGLDARFGGGGGGGDGATTAFAAPPARGSPEAAALLARWPLPAYAALRFSGIAASVEAALQAADAREEEETAPPPPPPANCPPLHTRPAATVGAALAATADPAGFLPALADRSVRAALQVASRYSAWLEGGAGVRRAAADKAGREEEGGSAEAAGATPPPSALLSSWAAAAPVDDTLLAASDAAALAAYMRSGLPAALESALGGGGRAADAAVASAAAAALGRGAARLAAAASSLLAAAGATAAAAAAPHLAQLRGVAATFRVTARPPPTRAAPYAAACLGPLAAMLGAGPSSSAALPGARALTPPARAALLEAAVSGIAARFEGTAVDLLASLRKAEESLARLKAGRPGAAAAAAVAAAGPPSAAASLSDADKVAAQVFLDVQAFGRAAAGLGCAGVADLPAFRSLWAAAVPEGRRGEVVLGRVEAVPAGAVVAPPPPPPPPPADPPAAPPAGEDGGAAGGDDLL